MITSAPPLRRSAPARPFGPGVPSTHVAVESRPGTSWTIPTLQLIRSLIDLTDRFKGRVGKLTRVLVGARTLEQETHCACQTKSERVVGSEISINEMSSINGPRVFKLLLHKLNVRSGDFVVRTRAPQVLGRRSCNYKLLKAEGSQSAPIANPMALITSRMAAPSSWPRTRSANT